MRKYVIRAWRSFAELFKLPSWVYRDPQAGGAPVVFTPNRLSFASEDREQWLQNISLHEEKFKTTNDPQIAAEVLMGCHHFGVPFPEFITQWIAGGMKAFIDSAGKSSLEECLYFPKRRKGQAIFAPSVRKNRDDFFMVRVQRLIDDFGCTLNHAAGIVEKLGKNSDIQAPAAGILPITAGTMSRHYGKWKKGLPLNLDFVPERKKLYDRYGDPEQFRQYVIDEAGIDPTDKPRRGYRSNR